MKFQKDGPKRRRHTRRELPEGGYSQYPKNWHPKLERHKSTADAERHAMLNEARWFHPTTTYHYH